MAYSSNTYTLRELWLCDFRRNVLLSGITLSEKSIIKGTEKTDGKPSVYDHEKITTGSRWQLDWLSFAGTSFSRVLIRVPISRFGCQLFRCTNTYKILSLCYLNPVDHESFMIYRKPHEERRKLFSPFCLNYWIFPLQFYFFAAWKIRFIQFSLLSIQNNRWLWNLHDI